MAAKIDIKKTSRMRRDRDGWRAERVAVVSGVSGTAEEVLYNAINDAALPDIGDAHPEVADITLNDIVCVPTTGGNFKVTMTYYRDTGATGSSSSAEARLSAGLSIEETHEDINGNPLDTAYYKIYPGGSAVLKEHRFTAEVERPRMNFEFEYTATGMPTADIQTYLGKINSTEWNGFPVGSILCSAIDADQSGSDFRVNYRFSYRAEGWQFVGKTSAKPPLAAYVVSPDNGLDLDTGLRAYDVYRSVDFSPLGFVLTNIGYPLVANAGAIRITGSEATLTVA